MASVGGPIPRRTFLAAGAVGVLAAGGVFGAGVVRAAARGTADDGPGPVPQAPPGDERVERRHSDVRNRDVDFYTAAPAGHGDGTGLPVCLILHGASATAADYPRFGFGRFLTDAVRRGAAPFVLAGATGSPRGWEAVDGDDPMRMVYEELPRWCAERSFDTSRLVGWGWSMGGYGVLRLAEVHAGFVRGVAAFSPAVSPGDRVFADVAALRGTGVGLWCGRDDGLYPSVRRLEQALPEPPRAGSYGPGHHTRAYWNRITPAAFDFVAATLAP
jgi:hypothetical protein